MGLLGSTQLQYYRHDYCKVCMTGLLGCRWHRYQQSTKGSTKRDVICFTLCLLVSLYVIFWFYFWLVADNDRMELNIYMFGLTLSRFNWFKLAVIIFSVLFAYVVILMLLSVCHMILGHQVYIHPVHCTLILLCLATSLAITITVQELWHSEWQLIFISLEVFGPFLQLGGVALMTFLSWVVISQWFQQIRMEWKIFSACTYCVLMLMLYISPIFISSPCVMLEENLPKRPKIFAHRGAPARAPENTVISFETAVQDSIYGIETDVQISSDGELFIMHDKTLQRTTDVDVVYPDLVDQPSSSFNFSQLCNLSAGLWFIENDPSSSVGSLSKEEKSRFRNQNIPTLLKLLEFCVQHDLSVILNLRKPSADHPYYNHTFPTLVDIVSMSGINKSKVYWPYMEGFEPPREWHKLTPDQQTVESLHHSNFSGIHFQNRAVDTDYIRQLTQNNLTSSAHYVNKPWLFSYYWCAGVQMVRTDYCDVISKVEKPVWLMSPRWYLVLWVVADCTSAVIIVILFCIQRYRLYGNRYHPERMSLSSVSTGSGTWGHTSHTWGPRRTRQSMKEKLLMRDIQADVFEPEDEFGIESSGYNATVTEMDGRELSRAFHSNRTSYLSNVESEGGQSYHSYSNGFQDNSSVNFMAPVENGEVFTNHGNSYQATNSRYDTDIMQTDIPT